MIKIPFTNIVVMFFNSMTDFTIKEGEPNVSFYFLPLLAWISCGKSSEKGVYIGWLCWTFFFQKGYEY